MAYSNWGGKVWCDGVARHENCDNTPQQVLDGTTYTHYLQHYLKDKGEKAMESIYLMYHAILGDADSGILVCLYKEFPSAVFILDGEVVSEVEDYKEGVDWWEEMYLARTINGIDVEWEGNPWNDERVICTFTDVKGRKWRGLSGYCIGEGYEDWD